MPDDPDDLGLPLSANQSASCSPTSTCSSTSLRSCSRSTARAADLGVSVDTVARTVETMLGGRVVMRYKRDAEQYDVLVQTASTGRERPYDIEKIFVRGRGDTMVPLSQLVKGLTVFVVPTVYTLFARRGVPGANLAPEHADAARAPESPEAPPLAKAGAD